MGLVYVGGSNALSGIQVLLSVAGDVALLLWGTHMVTSGVLRAYGSVLREKVGNALHGRWRPFSVGLATTLALQSSTATGLMAASFAANGLLAQTPGYVLMLGANLGTALVTQLLAFPIAGAAPLLLLAGVTGFRRSVAQKTRSLARVSIGLGLMLLALHLLTATLSEASQQVVVREVLGALGNQPLLAGVIGGAAAWACHSSVAVVLLVLSWATGGALPMEAALAAMLGANLGGALPPVFAAPNARGRRLPLGNLVVRGLGVALAALAFPWIVGWASPWGGQAVVGTHVAFNAVLALMALPLARPITGLVEHWLPDPWVPEDPGQPRYLDEQQIQQPHLALASAEREALRQADLVGSQLRDARLALLNGDHDAGLRAGRAGDAATALGRAIRAYLDQMASEEHSTDDTRRQQELSVFALHYSHAADLLAHHLIDPLLRRHRERGAFPAEQAQALLAGLTTLDEAHALAVSVLLSGDLRAAREAVSSKAATRDAQEQYAMIKPAAGVGWNPEVDEDLRALRELRHIHGQIIALAYHVLDHAGELRTRTRTL